MKLSKEIYYTLSIVFISIIAMLWFVNSKYYSIVFDWAQSNLILLLSFIFIWKLLSILYPPLVGGVVSIAAIPLIGWELAFLTDGTSTFIGGIINYFLAKKYGKSIVKKMLGQEFVDKIDNIKVKKDKEIESLIVLRLATGSVVVEFIHYLAGILKYKFRNYLIAMFISQILISWPLFYFAGSIIENKFSILTVLVAIPFLLLLIKYRKRYLE